MGGSVNRVILVGFLGADPDMRYTPSGAGTCELRVATNESWKGKDGRENEKVEWHRVVVWNQLAEICAKHLAKGRQVYVEGRIQTRTYDDKQGQKRYITEIIASQVTFLGGGRGERRDDDTVAQPPGDNYQPASGAGGGGAPMDDIPFGSASIGDEPSAVARALRAEV